MRLCKTHPVVKRLLRIWKMILFNSDPLPFSKKNDNEWRFAGMLWRLTDCNISGLHKSINVLCLHLISYHVVLLSEGTLISLCKFCIVQFLSHCELIDVELTSGTHLFSLKYISDQIGPFHLLSSIGDSALKFCFRLSSLKHSNILVEEQLVV